MAGENNVFKDIYYGSLDGIEESEEEGFMSLFYDEGSAANDLNNGAYLIIGRKGTGKTLLAKYFEKKQKEQGNNVDFFKSMDLMLGRFRALQYEDIKDDERKLLWQFVLLEKMIDLILSKKNLFFRLIHPIVYHKLKGVSNDIKSVNHQFKSFDKNLFNGKFSVSKKVSIGMGTEESHEEEYKTRYYEYIMEIRKQVYFFLNRSKKDYFVILDDGDELLQKRDDENFEEFMLNTEAILSAISELNSNFKSQGVRNSRFIETMRSDVFELIQTKSHNSNKVLQNAVKLNWIVNKQTRAWESELLKMIFHKLRVQSDVFTDMTDKEIFYKMFGGQGGYKAKERLFYNIVDLGFGRPRDFVMFLTIYWKNVPNRRNVNESGLQVISSIYLEYFWGEITNEINMTSNIELINLILDGIQSNHKDTFTFTDIYKVIRSRSQKYNIESVSAGFNSLYKTGIIGMRSEQNNIQFSYRSGSPSDIDLESDYLFVHNAVAKFKSLDRVKIK